MMFSEIQSQRSILFVIKYISRKSKENYIYFAKYILFKFTRIKCIFLPNRININDIYRIMCTNSKIEKM